MKNHEDAKPALPNKLEDASGTVNRREFVVKAGQAGLTTGLVHFMLVGAATKDAFAANDVCAAPPTPGHDVCTPTQENIDVCDPTDFSTGDACTTPVPAGSTNGDDACAADGKTGDDCKPVQGAGDDPTCLALNPDLCLANPAMDVPNPPYQNPV